VVGGEGAMRSVCLKVSAGKPFTPPIGGFHVVDLHVHGEAFALIYSQERASSVGSFSVLKRIPCPSSKCSITLFSVIIGSFFDYLQGIINYSLLYRLFSYLFCISLSSLYEEHGQKYGDYSVFTG
jgi:hypothetical protein